MSAADEGFLEASRAYSLGNWEACLGLLEGVEASGVDHLDLAYLLGLVHARLEHWDNALLYLEQVVTGSEEPLKVFQSRSILALIYSKTGRNRLAEYELGKLVDSGFETVQIFAGLGYAAWAQGKAEDALRCYSRAVELQPDNPNALNGLGYVLASTGSDKAKALVCCRTAVALAPDNAAYLDSLGWACFKAGLAEEARSLLARAISLAPDEGEILEHARALAGGVPPRGGPR